jgi:hypothetical protein
LLDFSISSSFEEEFEDTKSVIRIRKSKKNRVAKRKRTNNNLQNIHIKTKDRETRTTLKVGEANQQKHLPLSNLFISTHYITPIAMFLPPSMTEEITPISPLKHVHT